jgi:hypothetical protein
MIKRTKYFLLVVFLFGSMMSFAQYENTSGNKQQVKKQDKSQPLKKPKMKRWFVGGMLGGGFSSDGGYFQISPLIGYKVTPDFHVGSRLTYIFSSFRDYYGVKQQSHTYGASILGRYTFLKFLYAQAEFELLSYKDYYYLPAGERYLLKNLYLGGGLYQSFGNAFTTFGIFYNVLGDPNISYNPNPFIRIGFGVGF